MWILAIIGIVINIINAILTWLSANGPTTYSEKQKAAMGRLRNRVQKLDRQLGEVGIAPTADKDMGLQRAESLAYEMFGPDDAEE